MENGGRGWGVGDGARRRGGCFLERRKLTQRCGGAKSGFGDLGGLENLGDGGLTQRRGGGDAQRVGGGTGCGEEGGGRGEDGSRNGGRFGREWRGRRGRREGVGVREATFFDGLQDAGRGGEGVGNEVVQGLGRGFVADGDGGAEERRGSRNLARRRRDAGRGWREGVGGDGLKGGRLTQRRRGREAQRVGGGLGCGKGRSGEWEGRLAGRV